MALNDHHHISFRRQNVTYNEYLPFDQGSGLTGRYFNRPNQTNGLTWTWIINPSLINEARVTYSLDQVYIPVDTALPGFNRQTLGINFPYIIPGRKAAQNKIPTVSGLGSSMAWPAAPTHRTQAARSTRTRTASPKCGEITVQRRCRVHELRRKRQRPNQCIHRTWWSEQPERQLRLQRHQDGLRRHLWSWLGEPCLGTRR